MIMSPDYVNVMVLMPPLMITDRELDRLVGAVAESTRAAIASVTS